MPLPDYHGGSILNLVSTLAVARGGTSPYPPLRCLGVEQLASKRNVVLLLIDGLGYNHVRRGGTDTFLHRHLAHPLTSVFPSTTATAITSIMTGLAPQQHGLTGWHMYLSELDTVAAVLPFRTRSGNEVLAADAGTFFGHPSLFDGLQVATHIVAPQEIVDSDFNRAHSGAATRHGYRGSAELFATIERVINGGPERKFVYAYYSTLDALAHVFGIQSREVARQFARIDAAFEHFASRIARSDTTVIATADHGFIDSPPDCLTELDQTSELSSMLARPLCGERRVAYCYVRPARRADFERYIASQFGNKATLYPSSDLIAQHWFGPGDPHPQLASRTGDYTLIMNGNYTIKEWLPGEKRHQHIGVHGGLSEDEMYVPLIMMTV